MWRLSVVIKEIGANLIAERWRAVVIAVITAAATTSVVATELDQVRRAVAADAELKSAGRYVYVAWTEGADTPVNPTRCLALRHNQAVLAAGGYTHGGPVSVAKAPGELFGARMMVGDMPALLAPHNPPSPGQVYISQTAAARVGLADGRTVLLGGGLGNARVSVVDMSARVPDPGPWVWIPAAPGEKLDECWVEVVPAADQVAQPAITAWLSQGERTVIVTRFLAEDPLRTDPVTVFAARSTRYAWAASGVIVGVVVWLIIWFRRSEMALYRTVGSSRGQTTLIFVLPYMALMVVGTLGGLLLGIYIHGLGAEPTATSLVAARTSLVAASRQSFLALSIGILIALGGTLLTLGGSIAGHIRNRL